MIVGNVKPIRRKGKVLQSKRKKQLKALQDKGGKECAKCGERVTCFAFIRGTAIFYDVCKKCYFK